MLISILARADGGRSWQSSIQILTDPPQVSNLTDEWSRHTAFGPFDGEGYDGISLGSVTHDKQTGTTFVHYLICGHPCKKYGCQRPIICGPSGSGRMFYVASNDSFFHWNAPVEISQMLLPWTIWAPGPGEGTQAASGRLIICGYYSVSKNGTSNDFGSALILSDDHGIAGTRYLPTILL